LSSKKYNSAVLEFDENGKRLLHYDKIGRYWGRNYPYFLSNRRYPGINRRPSFVEVTRTVFEHVENRGLFKATIEALKSFGLDEIYPYNVKGNGCHIFAYEEGIAILGLELKNSKKGSCLTNREVRRIIKNLKPFHYKLLLFAHKESVENLSPEAKELLKVHGVHVDFVGRQILLHRVDTSLYFKYKAYEDYPQDNPLHVAYDELYKEYKETTSLLDPIVLWKKYNNETLWMLKKRLFRILHRMGALHLEIDKVIKKNGISKKEYRLARRVGVHGRIRFQNSKNAFSVIQTPKKIHIIASLKVGLAKVGVEVPVKPCKYMHCMYRVECEKRNLPECPRKSSKQNKERLRIFRQELSERLAYKFIDTVINEIVKEQLNDVTEKELKLEKRYERALLERQERELFLNSVQRKPYGRRRPWLFGKEKKQKKKVWKKFTIEEGFKESLEVFYET